MVDLDRFLLTAAIGKMSFRLWKHGGAHFSFVAAKSFWRKQLLTTIDYLDEVQGALDNVKKNRKTVGKMDMLHKRATFYTEGV